MIKRVYYYIIAYVFYKPFVKKAHGKFIIINPILFTAKYFIIGENVFIRNNARLEGVSIYAEFKFNPLIKIGNNVSIEQNLHLTCANKIIIGNNTSIAANVSITDIVHPYKGIDLPPEKQKIEASEVDVGDNCKIYNNVVLLPGTILGKHCIVGANSVVIGKQYPDYSIIVGAPAKIIKRYSFEKSTWLKTDSLGKFID
jgi:acetyltransferase-like isoleucine patch superfamily enzyme